MTFFRYLEIIINIFSNALVQTFLVYTTVVLIYKFFIEDQTTNYIPIFVSNTLNQIKKTYMELDYARHNFGENNLELEAKYQTALQDEIKIKTANKKHNQTVITNALKLSGAILAVFFIFALVTSRLSVHIKWYQLLLSAVITVVGTLYEYFFITQIIVKYNFIELTRVYDTIVNELDRVSDYVIKNQLKEHLQTVVNNTKINNNNTTSGIDHLISSATKVINNKLNINIDNNLVDRVMIGISDELGQTNNNTIKNRPTYDPVLTQNSLDRIVNGLRQNMNSDVARLLDNNNNNRNNLVNKAGITLNDIDHTIRKSLK